MWNCLVRCPTALIYPILGLFLIVDYIFSYLAVHLAYSYLMNENMQCQACRVMLDQNMG